jgi:PAS domain S-box-containing protein
MSKKKPTYQDLEKLIVTLKSEKKLQQNNDRFNMLLQASDDMITVHHPDGKYLYYNGPKCYAITTEDIVGKMPNELFNKDVSDTLMETFKKVKETGESKTIEVLLDWLGEKKWFSEYIYPYKNAEGEVVEIVKICKDIHQRKIVEQEIENQNKALIKSEKALKASNEKYLTLNKELHKSNKQLSTAKDIIEKSEANLRTLMNTIPDLIWLKSVDGKYLFVNNRFEDFFGAKEQAIIGKTDYDFVDKELAEFFREHDKNAMSNGAPTVNEEYIVFANDNHGELLETTKVPVLSKNKDIIGVLGIGKDITEKRKAEKALKASNEEYLQLNKELLKTNKQLSTAKDIIEKSEVNLRTLINNIPDLIWLKSVDGRYLFINNRTEDFFGAKEKNIIEKIDHDFVDKKLADSFRKSDRLAIKNGVPIINEQLLTFANDNHSELLKITKVPVLSKDKEILGVLGIGHDITEQRKAEKELIAEKEKAESNEKKLQSANDRYQLFNEALNKSNKELIIVKNKIKDSEVKFRAIFDHSTDAIVVTKNGIGVLFNPAYLKLFGYDRVSDLVGKKVTNQVSKKEREKVTNLIVNRNKGISESISYESIGLKKNGEEFNYEISVSPYNIENKRYSLGIIRDITERKLTQNELEIKTLKLKELNKSLNQAQKISNIGNWEWHIDSDTAVWSDEMYKIYGVSKDTFYPSHKNVAKTILPADTPKLEQGINSLLNGKIFTPFEFRIKRPSGEIRNLCVISIEKKSDFSFFGVTKDITNQKRIEDEKLKAAFKLEKTKNELNEAQKLAQIGSWLLHPTNKKMKWSEETFHIWGFDPYQNIPKYTKIIKLIHSDDVELFSNSVDEASMMGTPFDIKFRVSIPNQGQKIIKSICKPVLDDSGNVMHLKGTNQDITAQVRQQEKVLSYGAESRAMKSAVDAGWSSAEYTIDGTILKANKNFVKDFGYSSQKELIGKHHKIFYEPNCKNRNNYKDFWTNLARGKEQKGEFKRIKKDGTSIWINANYTPVKDVNGTYYKVIKIANNISEMVNSRLEVTAIANELRQFIETANAPIFGIDNQGLVNEWNQTSEKITGFKKEEVLGKDLVETYITKDYQISVKKVLDDALLGKETTNYEFPLFAKNGTRVMVLLNSSTRRDTNGQIIGVLGVGQDITQIDKLRTISDSIAKELRQFIETANAPIFGIDNQGNINEWNQNSEKITGFKKEEVLGNDLVETYITKDYQKAVRKVLDDALQGKETTNYELPLFAKDGTRLMVLFNSSTRRDNNGQIIGVLGVGQDITELDSYRNELEIKVNERTLKLNESLEKQKELNELKSRFVSTASHEFRTPLSAINFAAGSIKKYWTKMEPVMIDKKLHKIEDQVLHMTKLLDDVLVVGQADVGKMLNKPISINLGNFIYEIIEEINNSRNKSHEIILIDDADLIKSSIYIDEKLGRNIFINLLDNALKFSPDAKKVVVELISEKKYTIITIQDFGIGIPELELENIFSPFTRGENVDLIQGTGLGLSIVKEAVKLAGGEINVNSSVESGTIFTVKIPKT